MIISVKVNYARISLIALSSLLRIYPDGRTCVLTPCVWESSQSSQEVAKFKETSWCVANRASLPFSFLSLHRRDCIFVQRVGKLTEKIGESRDPYATICENSITTDFNDSSSILLVLFKVEDVVSCSGPFWKLISRFFLWQNIIQSFQFFHMFLLASYTIKKFFFFTIFNTILYWFFKPK